jgi:growth factor-regulated tyrosine kinase substrate
MYAPQPTNVEGYGGAPGAVPGAYMSHDPHTAQPNEAHNQNWGGNPYPSLGAQSPNAPPNNYTTGPAPSAPSQYYAGPSDPEANKSPIAEPPYQPSPVMRRDSQYQPSAPPGASAVPEQPAAAGYVHPGYSVPPSAPALHQQPSGPTTNPQSYYYPQAPSHAPSTYPPMTAGQPSTQAPEAGQASYQQPRPVEESLIEL